MSSIKNDFKKNAVRFLLLGIPIAAVAWYFAGSILALGVLAGTLVSIFNLWLVMGAFVNIDHLNPRQAGNKLMGRVLAKMVVTLTALLLSILGGVYFVIGVAVGLFLQVFIYAGDALKR